MMWTAMLGVVVALLLLASGELPATEWSRHFVDLDRDGKREVVKMEIIPGREPHRSDVRISVAGSEYRTDYFSLQGGYPTLNLVDLDDASGLAGLVLVTGETSWCVSHLLSYVEGRLHLLFKHEAGPLCDLSVHSGRRFSLSIWEGFWTRSEMHRISTDGRRTQPEPRETDPVQAAGYAGEGLELAEATCGHQRVKPGMYLWITEFDAANQRYRVETPDGACGWVPASEFRSDSPKIRGLPWGG